MTLDFTLSKYQELCEAVIGSRYTVWSIARYMKASDVPDHVVLLRHDIDRYPYRALQMARLEHRLGLQTTYYVRMTRMVFQPRLLKEITKMGHEIGYHYETLAKTGGNRPRAIALFEEELAKLREVGDIQTISMHGSPLQPYNNRDLWQQNDFKKFGLLGDTSISLDYDNITYLTDTGRAWGNRRYNVRDKAPTHVIISDVKTTDDLIAAIRRHRFDHLCISVHPERWPSYLPGWGISFIMDLVANHAKQIMLLVNRYQSRVD